MEKYDRSWVDRTRDAFRDNPFMRSGLVTGLLLAGVVGLFSAVWYAHLQGRLHNIFSIKYVPDQNVAPLVNGLELVHLTRLPMAATMTPEFVSATLAPGLGMQLLQLNLNVPSRGDVPLLATAYDDTNGNAINESVASSIVVAVAGRTGNRWNQPVDALLHTAADRVTSNAMPDGGGSDAMFSGIPKSGRTADNGVQTSVSVTFSGHALEFAINARNVVEEARAVTISWRPHFALPTGVGTMMMIPPMVEGSSGVVQAPIVVGTRDVDLLYTKMKRSYLVNGSEVQLRNDTDGYIVHLTALSSSVKSLRVHSSRAGNDVVMAFSTASGGTGDDSGTVLQPGESMQVRLRLEVTGVASDLSR